MARVRRKKQFFTRKKNSRKRSVVQAELLPVKNLKNPIIGHDLRHHKNCLNRPDRTFEHLIATHITNLLYIGDFSALRQRAIISGGFLLVFFVITSRRFKPRPLLVSFQGPSAEVGEFQPDLVVRQILRLDWSIQFSVTAGFSYASNFAPIYDLILPQPAR